MPLAHLADYLARAIMVVICRFHPPSDADLAVIAGARTVKISLQLRSLSACLSFPTGFFSISAPSKIYALPYTFLLCCSKTHWLKRCAKMIESPHPHHPQCNRNTVLQHCLYSRTFHQELAQLIWKGQCCTCKDDINPSRHKLALLCGASTMPPRQRSRRVKLLVRGKVVSMSLPNVTHLPSFTNTCRCLPA